MLSVSTINAWTVCVHVSSTDAMAKLLSSVDKSLIMCRQQFVSTTKPEVSTECPAWRKRNSWRKSTKNNSWAASKRLKRRNLVDQSLQIDLQVRKTQLDLKLIKIINSFPNGQVKYTSYLVSPKKYSLWNKRFLISKENCINQLEVRLI